MQTELKQNETNIKSNDIESELKEHLNRLEVESNGENTKNVPINDIVKPFLIPDFVLDFLQDKPIKIQEILITRGLSADKKEAVKHIFKPNENELEINRASLKEIIQELCTKYPEIQPYFSNKTIFFGTFAFGFYERHSMVESILKSENKNGG